MDLLSVYEDVSGQKINRDKTALFFSKSVTEANKQIIKGFLEFVKFDTMKNT